MYKKVTMLTMCNHLLNHGMHHAFSYVKVKALWDFALTTRTTIAETELDAPFLLPCMEKSSSATKKVLAYSFNLLYCEHLGFHQPWSVFIHQYSVMPFVLYNSPATSLKANVKFICKPYLNDSKVCPSNCLVTYRHCQNPKENLDGEKHITKNIWWMSAQYFRL